jgi:diguanylate cyclase (GGDEF)-like protein
MPEPSRSARVIVVDDSRFHREFARQVLQGEADVECCEDGEEALRALERAPADLVLSDLTMPGLSGLELLERVQREHPGTDFVLITAYASINSAVEALRMGATDYLQKPIRAEDLILVVERTLSRRRLLQENLRLPDEGAILEACGALTACLEPSDVYSVALDLVLQALCRERGIALYHRALIPSSEGCQFRGFSEDQESALRVVISRGKRLDFNGIDEIRLLDRGPIHDALRDLGISSNDLLALPVKGEDAETGVFWVLGEGRPFREEELDRALIVTSHTSLSLRNAEHYHRAKERALVDDVTEVYNARYLMEAMDREIRRAERYGNELSVLFLDLDRFKLVNDHHGHLVGSQALRQLSQVLGQCVRQVDTLARYGGDEFTIVLVGTGEETGTEIAERIRRIVAETAFEAGPDQVVHLTCSVGVSTYPTHGRTREALLDAADKAMYRAKSKGRNRVCSATELS